jgi:hypothetical protein
LCACAAPVIVSNPLFDWFSLFLLLLLLLLLLSVQDRLLATLGLLAT